MNEKEGLWVTQKPKDALVKQGEQIVKKKRGGKTPSLAHNTSAKAEDIRRIGASLLKWYKMEKAVTDEEIRERLERYFVETLEAGEIPTVEEMCLALGYPRQTIWRWETGEEGSTPARRNLIKKAKELLASFDAKMVQEGKINPVTYIFRAKNYFGLQDKQEYVLTPNNPLGDHANPDDIQKRLEEGVIDE
jgi:transcriptional regulator with XRE-family HTH domain